MKTLSCIIAVAVLAGCATTLTDSAQRVRIVTANQKERCEPIKMVTFNQRLGPDKPGNAMKAVLNETAAAGGNGLYVVSTSTDWAEGASMVGEALRCKE
jgi:hypothetical protein